MKGSKHPKNDFPLSPAGNETIRDIIARVDVNRRDFLKSSAAASAVAYAGGLSLLAAPQSASAAPIPASNGFAGIGFESIVAQTRPPLGTAVLDRVLVPPGYTAKLLIAWGDPIMPGAPDWSEDATQDAATQAMQYGMHNDGMHYFPFSSRGGLTNDRGVMCVNNEYTHEDILHGATGLNPVSIAKVRKSQAAHGVSIFEVRRIAGNWTVVRNSPYGRRLTSNTPMAVSGPAAGHPLMQSKRFTITPTESCLLYTSPSPRD